VGILTSASDTSPVITQWVKYPALERRTGGEFLDAYRLIGDGHQKWLESKFQGFEGFRVSSLKP
jgi:hypothetical protein